MGKVYYRHFAGTISGSPGSTSTISFDSALDASTDLKALVLFAVDAKAQNDASENSVGGGPMESYGITDLTNEFCSDSSHRDEATGADLGDMSSSINSALLHLYDEASDATFAECSYTSHTTSGFTVTWATQPTGTGTQLTYTGYAICGPSVEAEVRSDWISSTARTTSDTITFSSLTALDAVNIISVPDMATLGTRRLENCGINRAWLNSNGNSNAVLEKHALESDGAIRTVQGGFDNGTVAGTSRTDAHWQWKRFYQVSGAISGTADLDLTIGGTDLTWGLRYMCLGLYMDGAATGQATNTTATSTAFTPSPTVTNPGVIDGMVCGLMNTTSNMDSAYSQAWTGTVFDETDTSVGAFGMGSSSSANLTTKQNIASRTTPQNLPNSSSLYYRTTSNNSSELHAYVSSVNNTTGEVSIGWTPVQDTVANRFGVYFVLGQQAASGVPAQTITTTSIASDEAFGTPTVSGGGAAAQTVTATGITSAEAFGLPAFSTGAVGVQPTGIASAEALGTATISTGPVTVSTTGIASSEAFGVPAVAAGASDILPSGIASAEAFGTATIEVEDIQIIAAGFVDGAEDFGVPTLTAGASNIVTTGIPSEEAFGTATLTAGTVDLQPSGLASGEAFGTPTFTSGVTTLAPPSITSEQAFGTAEITTGGVDLAPTGIASEEAFGTPEIFEGQTISVTGIASEETFGTPALSVSGVSVSPTGIPSEEAFGSPVVDGLLVVGPSGISSLEAFGSPSLDTSLDLSPTGIPSAEAFGSPALDQTTRISPPSIESGEAFGVAVMGGGIPGVGVRIPMQASFDALSALEGKYDAIQTLSASV